jgi:preprotein translocase subunit SecG
MYALLLVLHLIICLSLIAVVLVQSGKGGGLAGGAFGGSAQTVFGGRGATDFFTRATMVLGAAFFLTSLTLALMSSSVGTAGRSLIQDEARRAPTQPAPAAPASPTTPAPTTPAPGGSTP